MSFNQERKFFSFFLEIKKAMSGKKEREKKAEGKLLLKEEREKAKRLGPTMPPKFRATSNHPKASPCFCRGTKERRERIVPM